MSYENLIWDLSIDFLPLLFDLLILYLIFDFLRSLLFQQK